MIISIEGNIGSGKSTLLRILKKQCTEFKFVDEPVDEWNSVKDSEGKNMIEKFYEDQEKYSFSFQMMAFISRLCLLKKCQTENDGTTITTISERSLFTDKWVFAKMLFDQHKIEDVNYIIYNKWFEHFSKECPVNKMIYIKTDPIVCIQRISKRNRKGESIPLDYLQDCNTYHDEMIEKMKTTGIDVLVIDGNQSIYNNLDKIYAFIGIHGLYKSKKST
jgi:deoxyguanosine kinase